MYAWSILYENDNNESYISESKKKGKIEYLELLHIERGGFPTCLPTKLTQLTYN